MSHGMSSGKKMVGASAAHAAAAEFLFRGYNVSFPEFDMGVSDDLLVMSPDSEKISRVQVRSRQFNRFTNGNEGASTEIYIPTELLTDDNTLDLVVLALRYDHYWMLGLFDKSNLSELVTAGVGSFTKHAGKDTLDLRARFNKLRGKVYFSGFEVTRAFCFNPPSKWDELFPLRNSQVQPFIDKDFEHQKRLNLSSEQISKFLKF